MSRGPAFLFLRSFFFLPANEPWVQALALRQLFMIEDQIS